MIVISEPANPLLTFIPIALMLFSGYSTGAIISKVRRTASPMFTRDLIYGNVALNVLFISGFVIFGILTSVVNEYFTAFTYLLIGISILGIYLLLQKLIISFFRGVGVELLKIQFINFKSLINSQTKIFVLFGIALFVTILAYQAIIIYYHPIYSEYDFIFRFLPISKSILLGNGLNHDFYLGSDVGIRFPPFAQAVNAWLLHSFEYSSIRMFPFYYVLLAAILVYSLTRNTFIKTSDSSDASFFGLIASSAFLITPAILVTSSRFALQQDIAFVFFLTASFYFLSEIVRYDKPAKTILLMFSSSLSLMILTREIGLVISMAIFFLVPAVKYTEGNLKLRLLFTVLSLTTFYLLSIKDLLQFGLTYTTIFRLITLLLANFTIYYIVSKLKNQNKLSSLIKPSYFKYMVPLIIPSIFIVGNFLIFSGPFPNFTFSGKISEYLPLYREISGDTNPITLDLFQAIRNLPRMDVLFISVPVGSAFLLFKLVGLGKIIYHLKNNYQYSLLLVLLILLLVTWSFLLQSGFQTSDIRHIAYFIPLLSIILVVGMKWSNESTFYGKLLCYGLIVLATIYFLFYNLYIWNYNNHFGGFWVEPNLGAIMTFADLRFAAVIVGLLILVELGGQKFSKSLKKYHSTIISTGILIVLLTLQIYVLSHSGIIIQPIEKLDAKPPSEWETNIFQIIDYLNNADEGNVLSVRAPAIPFFTNRTNFDVFNTHTFSYSIAPLLTLDNSSALKEKFSDMGIKYVVIPNEKSPLYHLVKNLMNESKLIQLIDSDDDFDRVNFDEFSLYRYDPNLKRVNLLDDAHTWKSTKNLDISKNTDNLQMLLITNETQSENNYAYIATQSDNSQTPVLLSMNYTSMSLLGTATFRIDIYDLDEQRTLYSTMLNNTSGSSIDQTFVLPDDIVLSRYLEFRLYISADGPGEHILNLKRIILA